MTGTSKNVTKRNGVHEPYTPSKIKKSIKSAFDASHKTIQDTKIDSMVESISAYDGINVEDIQNQVETILMKEEFYDVAKNYILYRQRHEEDREIAKRVDFLTDYCNASNAATGSKYDANANVEKKNVTTLIGELPKEMFIRINRRILTDRIKKLYGKDLADRYLDLLDNHFIYKNDETSLANYTYCAQETVNVKYKGRKYLLSFEQLYDLCEEEEQFVDKDRIVYIKYPKDMQIIDKDGYTEVQRLIRKKRHRDLVRVKTAFGEDIIVTDNHPMIISENIEDTVDAINVLGKKQYRSHSQSTFGSIDRIDVKSFASDVIKEEWEDSYTIQSGKNCKITTCPKSIELDEELGYLVGFFIGDGNYRYNEDIRNDYVNIAQKEKETLIRLGSIASRKFGAQNTIIDKRGNSKCDVLSIHSPVMVKLCADVFKIGHLAQNKTLPINIYEYNKNFAIGIIEGLLDSDGTITAGKAYCIRTSSRTLMTQLSDVLRTLGYGTSSTTMKSKFGCNDLIQTKYQIFGVTFAERIDTPELKNSYKAQGIECHSDRYVKYRTDTWSTVTNLELIDNEKFLEKNEFIYDITTASHTFICNNILVHNCASITMYPWLTTGTKSIGGNSTAPSNLRSFCGGFINMVFMVSSMLSGACATPEFLMYMNYFIGLEYGQDYYKHPDKIVDLSKKQRSIDKVITDCFEQICYSINQPTGARNFQSVFWNIAYYDENYFNAMFGNFFFPDGSRPDWESLSWLQKRFMKWFNKERERSVLTFPVETMALLSENGDIKDKDYADFTAEMYAEGHSFFTYVSDNADSLSSCCRLRNQVNDNGFSYTLGAGGVSTGSKSVLTINLNRCIQYGKQHYENYLDFLEEVVDLCHKVQICYNENLKELQSKGMLPLFDAGYINLSRQYLTIGVNGLVEAAEYLGIEISDNDKYRNFVQDVLGLIENYNKKYYSKEEGLMFNCEMIPAENVGVKHAKWDREDGYFVPRDCYNSYFYIVEDTDTNVLDKFKLHGKNYIEHLTGGSALHCNLEEHLSKAQYRQLLKVAAKEGCNYFTFNIPNTVCEDCGHIDKRYLKECPHCHSKNITWITRIIGYLKKINSFSEARQKEAALRYYGNLKENI